MMNTSSGSPAWLLALVLAGLAGCKDSGHSLGDSRDVDAKANDAPVATGGSGGVSSLAQAGYSGESGISSSSSSGSSAGNAGGSSIGSGGFGGSSIGSGGSGGSSMGSGGSGGNSGGQGGASTAQDAGAKSDVVGCGTRDDSCTNRPCCAPFLCSNMFGPTICLESARPPADAAVSADTRVTGDTKCPVCPPMKCSNGSPVDSNGCTICTCNPGPDGGADTAPRCPVGGCLDADLSTPCPASPPSNGSPCLGQSVCNYEDCPGAGHTQVTCRSEKWVVANGACDSVICLGANGDTCAVNKVCLVHSGGALRVECIDNPCSPGLIKADCSTVTSGCTPLLSTSSGLTYYCDTCPGGGCP